MAKSKISLNLNKKRKIAFVKKIGVIFVLVLFLISLFILFLTTEKIKIKKIEISGNLTVSDAEIISVVKKELEEKYLWIIPTDNIFFLQRFEIQRDVFEGIKKIKNVKVVLDNFNILKIKVLERDSDSLWCLGSPDDPKDCYFMDGSGFIFSKAPDFTKNIFIKYYGFIFGDDPIGKNYFLEEKFREIKNFISEIKKIGFEPELFFAIDEHQYEIIVLGDVKIMFDDKEGFSKNILKLNTLIENDYIKTNLESISRIKHIDLRYGNKVHYDFK